MNKVLFYVVLAALLTVSIFAQKPKQGVSVTAGQFTFSVNAQAQNDAVILPLIEGKQLDGAKERFGILFRASQVKNNMIEIMDENGKTIQTITVNDFIGKSANDKVKLVSNTVSGAGRASETIHEVKLPGGTVKVITKALLSGDKNNANNPQQIVLTFSIASSTKQNLGMRILLPFEGNGEAKNNGVVLSGKSSSSVLAVTVMPGSDSIIVRKNSITALSPTVNVSGEMPMVWMIVRNAIGASQGAAKAAAGDIIVSTKTRNAGPNILMVNMISKENAQPGDTVTYSLVCKNIGTGAATDIIMTNPIPSSIKYLEGSATVEGTEFSVERSSVPPPQSSTVTLLRWKLKEPLSEGKEYSVNYKVVVQ